MVYKDRSVVITGMGVVGPTGIGKDNAFDALARAQSGIKRLERVDVSDMSSQIAGQITSNQAELDAWLSEMFDRKFLRQNDPFIAYGMAAAKEALADAGWASIPKQDQEKAAIVTGSGIGGLGTIQEGIQSLFERGPRRVMPYFVTSSIINSLAGQIALQYQCLGGNESVVTACATGSHALISAARMIALGETDIAIAGGSEAPLSRIGVACFASPRALATGFNESPEKASRPWDRDRSGFVIGEGAGMLVLESYENAMKRGAKIYATLSGFGTSCDAYHMTAPHKDGLGAISAMQKALHMAGCDRRDIGYINAHGTSTIAGDPTEARAIRAVFAGKKQDESISDAEIEKLPYVSSTKSATGHLLGAAGAVEAIFSIMAMNKGMLPPTLNLDQVDDGCEMRHVANQAVAHECKAVMSNSFGFGGTNASIIFSR